jgi:hypothetical protein
LKDEDFTLITVALERNTEDPKPYVEKADPDHPSLIDTRHRVAELYSVENVPTSIWIDKDRRIVRPNDVVFGSDTFDFFAGADSDEHRNALRKWVREEDTSYHYDEGDESSSVQDVPGRDELKGRNEYRIGQWLYQHGYENLARDHLNRATELCPEDVTIRRGSMRMRDENPMGWGFFKMAFQRWWNGLNYYNPLGQR